MDFTIGANALSGLFIFYLIILGNFMGELVGCRVQEIFTELPAAKHLIGLFTLYYFINLATPEASDPVKTSGYTAAMYLVFLVSRDIPIHYFLSILLCMFIIKMIDDYQKYHYKDEESKKTTTYNRMKTLQKGLTILILILLIVGFIKYTIYQRRSHQKDWHWSQYIFGSSGYVCDSLKDTKTLGSNKISNISIRKLSKLYTKT